MSVHFWGENPEGVWQLQIANTAGPESDNKGIVTKLPPRSLS